MGSSLVTSHCGDSGGSSGFSKIQLYSNSRSSIGAVSTGTVLHSFPQYFSTETIYPTVLLEYQISGSYNNATSSTTSYIYIQLVTTSSGSGNILLITIVPQAYSGDRSFNLTVKKFLDVDYIDPANNVVSYGGIGMRIGEWSANVEMRVTLPGTTVTLTVNQSSLKLYGLTF